MISEQEYLSYSPRIGYKVNINLLINTINSQLSVESQEALESLASNILDACDYAEGKINDLINESKFNLIDDIINGKTINDYIEAKKNSDVNSLNTVREWEDWYRNNIDASMYGEVLPLLIDFNDKVTTIKDVTKGIFFKDIDDNYIEYEVSEIKDNHNNEDYIDTLKTRSEIIDGLKTNIDILNTYIDDIDSILYIDMGIITDDSTDKLVDEIINNNINTNSISEMNKLKFNRENSLMEDRIGHLSRIISNDNLANICESVKGIYKLKLDTINQIKDIVESTIGIDSQISRVAENLIDVFEDVESTYDSLLLDLYKFSELSNIKYREILQLISQKQICREYNKTLNLMQGEDLDTIEKIKKFVEIHELEKQERKRGML